MTDSADGKWIFNKINTIKKKNNSIAASEEISIGSSPIRDKEAPKAKGNARAFLKHLPQLFCRVISAGRSARTNTDRADRYSLLDTFRGITILSMICYHGIWDLVFVLDIPLPWYTGEAGFIWQQTICWSFILLSGFCMQFSRRSVRNGLQLLLISLVITLITALFLPEERIIFGVLTLLGISMLLTEGLKKLRRLAVNKRLFPADRAPHWGWLLLASGSAFVLLRDINQGYLGFGPWRWIRLPRQLYDGLFMTFLGFEEKGFFSTDYFSLLPWYPLFLTGYALGGLFLTRGWLTDPAWKKKIRIPAFLGQHSLLIYLLHQPLLFGIAQLLDLCS